MKKFGAIILAMALLIPNLSHAFNEKDEQERMVRQAMAQCDATAAEKYPNAERLERLQRCWTVYFVMSIYQKGTTEGHINAIYGKGTEKADMEYFWEQSDLLWEKVVTK